MWIEYGDQLTAGLRTNPPMSNSATMGQLPDYKTPPVVETILGVQFQPLPGLKNGHLGAFWKTLDVAEWPTISDAPPLPSQFERFAESFQWTPGIQLQFTQDPASRLQISNRDGDGMIQLQNGRLHFNWLGKHGVEYPRYEKVREGFVGTLQRFIDFLAEEKLGELRANQWEVTYLNHIPQGTVWNTPDDWTFFRPLASVPTAEAAIHNESFDGQWHFVIRDQLGRLHVQWQHATKPELEKQEIIALTFTARGPIEQGADAMRSILAGLDLGRRTIVCSFKDFMSDAANNYWGLNHAESARRIGVATVA